MKNEIVRPVFLLYISKCLIGTIICYGFYLAFPQYYLYWSIVSLLLVLAPDLNNSIALPIARIKANVTGAIVGFTCFLLPIPQLLGLCLGVVATILICTIFNYSSSIRSALAALVIVRLQEVGEPMWSYALQRIVAVILGCIVALALTLLFRSFETKLNEKAAKAS